MKNLRYSYTWLLAWLVFSLGAVAAVWIQFQRDEKTLFLPGETTHGHYQIEMQCAVCHTPFGGVRQEACMDCHGAELRLADDSHPKKKFDDPRNADRVAVLDARQCTTCHGEHRPERTHAMGLTLPPDYCYRCHEDIGEDRPSHAGLAFNSCQTAGCHNYHDNRGLYEDFLAKHLDEEDTRKEGRVPSRSTTTPELAPVSDAPGLVAVDRALEDAWAASAHGSAGVNCSACHVPDLDTASTTGVEGGFEGAPPGGPSWDDTVALETCQGCHAREAAGFLAGRHGMRLKEGLSPMTPGDARLPMKSDAAHAALTCNACHGAHEYDTRFAAVDACLSCHDDTHSRSYRSSPHFVLWRDEVKGGGAAGSGVSCATCHLPRMNDADGGVFVEHNQNDNLRPNEKMLRDVCLHCHGLGFSIDALADEDMIQRNFEGRPADHVPSLDWVKARVEGREP